MSIAIGCQSMVGRIETLILKHPRDAFLTPQNVARQWKLLNYTACPHYDKAVAEYDAFVALLDAHVPELYFLPPNEGTGLDSIYVHDPCLITDRGAILCNMGKEQRAQEPRAFQEYFEMLGVPVLGAITGEGTLEGGDVVWLDRKTLAVGRGYRTNDEGIRQLREITRDFVDRVIPVPLPHWQGPAQVLHLMSLISPVDEDLLLVFSKLLPVPFRELLCRRGVRLLEVPETEFDSMACNVLALAPRQCVMLAGNPLTKALLQREGVEVWEYQGQEICLKGAGGPTCLTRPIRRR